MGSLPPNSKQTKTPWIEQYDTLFVGCLFALAIIVSGYVNISKNRPILEKLIIIEQQLDSLAQTEVRVESSEGQGNQVGNVSVSVGPHNAASSRTDPHTAASLRGGYTTKEVADLLNLSVREIQDKCKSGELACVMKNGHYLIQLEPQ